jgi:hypothetical protein
LIGFTRLSNCLDGDMDLSKACGLPGLKARWAGPKRSGDYGRKNSTDAVKF